MESEYIFNSMALNLLLCKYLVIAEIKFLAAHDTHFRQVLTVCNKISQGHRCNTCSTQVQLLNKLELIRHRFDSFILNFYASK